MEPAGKARAALPAGKATKADLIAEAMRFEIALGILPTGAELPSESEASRRFNASRPSYREALRMLDSEGLIVVARGARGGARVAEPGLSSVLRSVSVLVHRQGAMISELLSTMLLCEPAAARIIAQRADRRYISKLAQHVAAQKFSLDDRFLFNKHETAFRSIMFEHCDNRVLALICALLSQIFERHIDSLARHLPRVDAQERRFSRSIATKERFLDALMSGNADDAETHWRNYVESYCRNSMRELGGDSPIAFYSIDSPPTEIASGSTINKKSASKK